MNQSPTLTCWEVAEHATDYLDAALAPDIVPPYEAHLAACAECEAFLRQIRTTITLTHTLAGHSHAAPDPAARARLLRAFRDWRSGELP